MKLSDHFGAWEFACRCRKCGLDGSVMDPLLIWLLETLRADFGDVPIKILSGHRCPAYNKQIGGAKKSWHLHARAADFVVFEVPANIAQEHCIDKFRNAYGLGRYRTFTHLDTRPMLGRWDNRGTTLASLQQFSQRLNERRNTYAPTSILNSSIVPAGGLRRPDVLDEGRWNTDD